MHEARVPKRQHRPIQVPRQREARKASQNRPDTDVDGIVAGLTADGLGDAAALVRDSRRA